MYTGIKKPVMEQTMALIVGVLGLAICVALFAGQIMA